MKGRPVVSIAVCWTLGYALSCQWHLSWCNLTLTIVCGMLGCMVLFLKPPWRVWMLYVLLVAASTGVYGEYDARNQTGLSLPVDEETAVQLQGRIISPVLVDGDRVTFQAEVGSIRVPGEAIAREGQGERMQVSVRLLEKEEQERAAGWQRGDRIELSGTIQSPSQARNFGGFDYRRFLRYQHIHWQVSAKGLSGVTIEPPASGEWGAWLLLRWNDQFRELLAGKIEELYPPDQQGFMKAMLVGLTDDIDPLQFDHFSRLGLTHLIAISGLNVAIFLACLLWILRRLKCTKETSLLISIAFMPLYIALTGGSPSIVRAGMMAMIGLYAAYRNRLKDGLHLVLIAGVGMLIWNPYYLVDVSFQLSYLVTLGLILGVPQINKLLTLKYTKLRDALSITLVAQLISFPVSIFYFNQFSLLSLAANFVLVPVFSLVVMPVGAASMIIGFIVKDIGQWLAWIVAQVNSVIFQLAAWSSRLDGWQTIWPSPTPLWIIIYYALLALTVFLLLQVKIAASPDSAPMLYTAKDPRHFRRMRVINRFILLPVCTCGFLFWLWYGYGPERSSTEGKVQFLDVGQGDCILIQTPESHRTILVDGGGTIRFRKEGEEWKERKDPYEVGKKLLVPLLKKRGVQQIDELILTHQDADHYGGLQTVMEQIPVRRLLFNGTLKPDKGVEKLFQTALERGTVLVKAYAGDRLEADKHTVLHILYPFQNESLPAIDIERQQNVSSIVFLMEMEGTRWLFAGDMEQAAEYELLDRWSEAGKKTGDAPDTVSARSQQLQWSPPIDVLKIAHHGSKTSTSARWLESWRPKHGVISVGVNNIYRHPNQNVLDRLATFGVSVHRTDLHGEVQMSVKQGRIQMRTKLGAGEP